MNVKTNKKKHTPLNTNHIAWEEQDSSTLAAREFDIGRQYCLSRVISNTVFFVSGNIILHLSVFIIIITITTTISSNASIIFLSAIIIGLKCSVQISVRVGKSWLCTI